MSPLPLRHGPNARDVQGNVLAAFNKPYATFLFVALPEDVRSARAWVGEIEPLVAVTEDVEDFYEERRARRKQFGAEREQLAATWTGLGLTWPGLQALAPDRDLSRDLVVHWAFRVGASGRALDLGDRVQRWYFGCADSDDAGTGGHPAGGIDAVVTVAADEPADLDRRRADVVAIMERRRRRMAWEQACAVLPGRLKGREHFGFKDGVSQPAVYEFHGPDPEFPKERKGHRGQTLVAPGEFVLGWDGEDGERPQVADWLMNASFQVVRRIDQDVAKWQEAIAQAAGDDRELAKRWSAELVGRLPSGAPLAAPGERGSDAFDYKDDPEGRITPLFAHVRKVFPRGLDTFEPQRHRLIRRGIPFGVPFDDDRTAERGMMFNAFMASIERQFEYVQRLFANKPDFPQDRVGPDALIGGRDPVADRAGRYEAGRIDDREGVPGPVRIEPFVETRGCVYVLAPSKAALAWLAAGAPGSAASS